MEINREAGVWIAIALLSIGTLGVAGTTIESTIATDPADVIDLDYDEVPIGQDDAANIRDEIEGTEEEETSAAESDDESQAATSEESTTTDDSAGGSGSAPVDPSLLDRLLALLAALVPYLLLAAAILGAAGLAIRYRDRIREWFEDDHAPPRTASSDWLDGPPSNAVEDAWVEMVSRLDLERPSTMTPSECASAAVEAGFDPDAVRPLTRAFEEIRYGGRPVTDRLEAIAERSRRRLDREGTV